MNLRNKYIPHELLPNFFQNIELKKLNGKITTENEVLSKRKAWLLHTRELIGSV